MKKHLITSALPYINGIKHLGNLVGSMLPADVYARFLRQSGADVLYICGTDEHGTPAEIAAQKAGMDIKTYCDQMYETQKNIYKKFNISFDYFGRSSDQNNHIITQDIYNKLKSNGYISEKNIQQFYSNTDQRFLPDRYVEGQCYKCNFDKARGDQCDGCGSLLDPEKLIDPYSTISGSHDIELRNTKHLFLNLEKLQGALAPWVEQQTQWPDVVKGIAKKWIKEGLQARCITRDLKWGVTIPEDDFDGKVFYVWFDAPNGYISMTKDWAEQHNQNWQDWWKNDDVQYTQFMAKDNVPFHAIFWPAMLLGANDNYKTVDYIKGFHWLTYDGGKFSTSNQRGIFTDTALELFESDYWRYYLTSQCPETADSDFTFEHFATIVNKDLADVLGNFCNRTLSLVNKYYDGQLPLSLTEETLDQELSEKVAALLKAIDANLKQMKFRAAMQELRSLWVLGNEYIATKEPWKLYKTDQEATKVVLMHCLHLMRVMAVASFSVIPNTAQKICNLLNDETALSHTNILNAFDISRLQETHNIKPAARLFTKIEKEQIEELTTLYAGN